MGKQALENSLVFIADTHALVFDKLLDMILSNPAYDIFPLNDSILRRISELKQLKDLHDRAILATALELKVSLITKDSKLKDIGLVKIVW